MTQDFRAAWAEIKKQRKLEQQRTYSASSFVPPTKTSSVAPRRRKMASIDHLVAQLVDTKLEAELLDAKWYKARREIYERDPRNFNYNTRLG